MRTHSPLISEEEYKTVYEESYVGSADMHSSRSLNYECAVNVDNRAIAFVRQRIVQRTERL